MSITSIAYSQETINMAIPHVIELVADARQTFFQNSGIKPISLVAPNTDMEQIRNATIAVMWLTACDESNIQQADAWIWGAAYIEAMMGVEPLAH